MELVIVPSGRPGSPKYLEALERGDILMFPQTPFEVAAEDKQTLLGAGQADGNYHKNIAYRPASGRLTGLGKASPGEAKRVHKAIQNYSRRAIELLSEVLAPYQPHWRRDYASFRSIEEEGRTLPLKKRNDLLHTDAFPTRPTNGGLILRIFSNINPEKSRDWMTSDPFPVAAAQFARPAGLPEIIANAGSAKRKLLHAARSVGLPVIDRSPYDEFMLGFHDYLKMNADYQRDSPKYRFHFPPGATWIVFTDVVPHAVLAGRYALEQTMIVARESLNDPGRAPASILEKLSGKNLHILYKVGLSIASVAGKEAILAMLGTILLVILILALVGSLPTWGYSNGWGYYPSGGLGLVVLIVVILLLLGRI